MYRLPDNFDGTFLIGCILEQICFNQNQASFHFSNEISIVSEDKFSYQWSGLENCIDIYVVPIKESKIMKLLGCSIIKVHGDTDGTLTIEFEHGDIIKYYDTSSQFESYQIINGDNVIVV